MAAAIARSLVHDRTTTVRSAGAFADNGSPITPESLEALKSLGVDAKEAAAHRSRELTRQMIQDATAVFAMTAAHARAIRTIDPTSADKIKLLDPDGHDVPDPIGGSQAVYTRTAERLKDLIQRRLQELGP